MGESLKALFVVALVALSISSATAAQPPAPGDAAVVGGWSGNWGEVRGIVLRSVVQEGGCLKLNGGFLTIRDHLALDHLVSSNTHRLPPGIYAVFGVQWVAPYYDQYSMGGVSPQDGDLWTITVAPNVITDLGIWPVTSPYSHRYILNGPDRSSSGAETHAAAAGAALVVPANWTRSKVADEQGRCPT